MAPETASDAWPGTLLIADDFGLNTGCERAIMDLANAGRLSGTSVLTNFADWTESAARLRELRGAIAVGLHINLTEGAPLTALPGPDGNTPHFQSLTPLVLRAHGGRLDQASVTAEIIAQIERFERDVGAPPDFVDGHQHVHVLPVVRDALFAAIATCKLPASTLYRSPADQSARIRKRSLSAFKSLVISSLSTRFKREAGARNMNTNDGFSGITTLDETANVTDEFVRAFTHPGSRHLVMCHPGVASGDLLEARRQAEYDALMTWEDLPHLVWRPARNADGRIDWLIPRHQTANAHAI